jgi:hypothetical protein
MAETRCNVPYRPHFRRDVHAARAALLVSEGVGLGRIDYGRSAFPESNAVPELIPELGRAVGTLLAAGLDIEPTARSVSSLPGNVCLTGSDGLLIGYKVVRQFESHPLHQPVVQNHGDRSA